MSVKEFIKSLTFVICLLQPSLSYAGVKDILNSHNTTVTTCKVHNHYMQTFVQQFQLEDNRYDGKDIVVIDAGHGGHDPGAQGKHSKEKEIALEIALKIGQKLKAENAAVEVVYTRDKDVFIPLHQRIRLANKKKADLFISIHCNYVNNPDVCGTETFVMGLHRAEENLNVAKRENSAVLLESDYENNYEGYDPNSPVGHILLSMYQNIFLEQSIELASQVESYLDKRKRTDSRGVKQAGFVVLRQATMPSVLIETGFLSNPKEERYLLSSEGQWEMASSVSKGIEEYFNKIKIREFASEPSHSSHSTVPKFAVQIGAFTRPIDQSKLESIKNYGEIITHKTNGLHTYAIGYFDDKAHAYKACSSLKSSGFKDAFVKSYPSKVTD